jgi:hypothetical protein
MRRHQLAKLGFNTGSPFIPQRSISAHEWRVTYGNKNPNTESDSNRSSTSPSTHSNMVSHQPAATGARSSISDTSVPARVGVSGRLDPGRLALARSTYERITSAPTRLNAGATKRARENSVNEGMNTTSTDAIPDNESHSQSSNKRVKLEDESPAAPLEAADQNAAAQVVLPAAPSISPSSSTFVLDTPLSSLVSSRPLVVTSMDLRSKSRLMLSDCLKAAKAASSADAETKPAALRDALTDASPDEIAAQIEEQVLKVSGGSVGAIYRHKLRDLVFNLRAAGNAPLRISLLRGHMSAVELVQRDFKQLATPDVAADREQLRQENFDSTIYRPPIRIETSEYKCPQCGSNQCSTMVIREERDISKADTWGSKQGAGSVVDVRCEQCKHSWTKEE